MKRAFQRRVSSIWRLHLAIDYTLIFGSLFLCWRFGDQLALQITLPIFISIGLFNQFTFMHESAHLTLPVAPMIQRWIGWSAGVLLYFPFLLWSDHHRLHHRNVHLIHLDNAFHPGAPASSRFSDALVFLFRTLFIGVSMVVTSISCMLDHLRWVTSYRIGRPSIARAGFGVLSFALSAVLTVALAKAFGARQFLIFWVAPCIISHSVFAAISFLQHIHPSAPFRNRQRIQGGIEEATRVTNHLTFPKWFHLLTHHAHYHLAHHIWSSAPYYQMEGLTHELEMQSASELRKVVFSPQTLLFFVLACSRQRQTAARQEWLPLFQGETK